MDYQWESIDAALGAVLTQIHTSFLSVRRLLRYGVWYLLQVVVVVRVLLTGSHTTYHALSDGCSEMGERADVPIEPPEQRELVDATMAIPGVLIAGVPGGSFVFNALTQCTSKSRLQTCMHGCSRRL